MSAQPQASRKPGAARVAGREGACGRAGGRGGAGRGPRQLFSMGPAACSKRFAGGGMTRKELRFLSMLGPRLIPPGLCSESTCARGREVSGLDFSGKGARG